MPRELPRTLVTVFSFLRQPKWIIFTLLLPLGIAVCLFASHWQYTRHVHRSALNTLIHTNAAQPVVGVADLLTPANPMPPEDAYRRVVASGSFTGPTSLVRKRPLDGEAGFWVVDTLRTDSGPLLQSASRLGEDDRHRDLDPVRPLAAGRAGDGDGVVAGERAGETAPSHRPAGRSGHRARHHRAGCRAAELHPYLVAQAMIPTDTDQLKPVPMPDPVGSAPGVLLAVVVLRGAAAHGLGHLRPPGDRGAARGVTAAATGAANGDDASDDPNGDERIDDEVPADR